MLGSNPSADSGPKTEAGCLAGTPLRLFPLPRDWAQSDKSRGLGAGPQSWRLARCIKPGPGFTKPQKHLIALLKLSMPTVRSPRQIQPVRGLPQPRRPSHASLC